MTEQITRSVEHATFVLEREYPATRERVYAALSSKEQKGKWFGGGGPGMKWDFDFTEGGREYNHGEHEGHSYTFDAIYLDIVENERITWSYKMYVNGVKLSASLTVVELTSTAGGTRLTFTETGAYYDGHEDPKLRETGSDELLDALGASLD
ncbi:MAG: hypothetical protein JWQ39_84 [Glaciihabitans sp.]|jgi:uncharacterized protein YndB with AHSA1/START domain|nr:hypothetical protein [Glaciihabitans sp.]